MKFIIARYFSGEHSPRDSRAAVHQRGGSAGGQLDRIGAGLSAGSAEPYNQLAKQADWMKRDPARLLAQIGLLDLRGPAICFGLGHALLDPDLDQRIVAVEVAVHGSSSLAFYH
jgi:hypothetical protein